MRTINMPLFSLIVIISVVFSFSSSYTQQNFQDWQKKQKEEFEKFKAVEQQKFQKFKDKRDSAFVEFLKKEWQAMELLKCLMPDRTPKPVDIPITQPQAIPQEMLPEPSKTIERIQTPIPPIEKKAESIESLLAKFTKAGEPLMVTFFDVLLKLNYDKAIKEAQIKNPYNGTSISNFWAELSRTKYEDLLAQAKTLKEQMQLNDWGYCLFLYQIGEELFENEKNKINLFIWFMMVKSDYDAKVGYNENEVYLLIPSQNIIYGAPYFIMEGKKYYVVTFANTQKKATSVYTYEGSYPGAGNSVVLNIRTTPLIRQAIEERQLKFTYQDIEYTLSLKLKRDVIDFYNNYPQTDFEVYFGASLSPEAQYSLLKDLKPIIEGKSEVEAVNILLRFVQTAFAYKNDDDQFGHEKPFFAEETLFYPYSDCEDRSVLFAYLVRNLLGLEVIGLDYPGHIAAAVKFSTNVNGDYVEHNAGKYIICDATYINASLGECIPRFKNIKPKVISIGKNN